MSDIGNGRIYPGQPLRSAISARAWNRAQDAADIVLGSAPQITTDNPQPFRYCIVGVMQLDSDHEEADYPIGTAFEIKGWKSPSTSGSDRRLIKHLVGRVAVPSTLVEYESPATIFPKPFGVSIEPIKATATAVRVAVSGLVVARIRRVSDLHHFVSLPVDRYGNNETATGVLETSDVGFARLVGQSGAANAEFSGLIIL